MLWIELWVRALQEPRLLPECEALSRRWRGYFFDAVRRGTEAGEFAPVTDPDEVAERLIALGRRARLRAPARLLVDLARSGCASASTALPAEQLGIERRALERDARQ